jgi:hypothetical protein
VKQIRLSAMTDFAPRRACPPHHFDIYPDRQGRWIARDRDGLAGGTFVSRRAALRFALFETDGDCAYVHEAGGVRRGGLRP